MSNVQIWVLVGIKLAILIIQQTRDAHYPIKCSASDGSSCSNVVVLFIHIRTWTGNIYTSQSFLKIKENKRKQKC